MEGQPVAQPQVPSQAAIFYYMAFDHLRLSVEFRVVPVKRVVDCQSKVAGNVGGSPNRVERGEVGVRHEGKGLLRLRVPELWYGESRRTGKRRFQETPPSHSQRSPPIPRSHVNHVLLEFPISLHQN